MNTLKYWLDEAGTVTTTTPSGRRLVLTHNGSGFSVLDNTNPLDPDNLPEILEFPDDEYTDACEWMRRAE